MSSVEEEQHAVAPPVRAGRREWIGLGVLALPLLLVSMDVSVLYFAVPFISQDLHATATEQLWIFDIYGFVLSGLLITMGSLGDRIGRRRLLMIGAVAFGAASLAAAYATSPAMLIAARAMLGIGGATLMPSTLALIRNMFHDPAQRGRAIAVWTTVTIGGVSLGPVLCGLLLEHFWWGSVFLINAPFMVLLLLLAPVLLPEYRISAQRRRFDLLSSALSLASLLPLIYGIKRVAVDGPDVIAMAGMVAGVLVGLVFVRRQRTHDDPMIDLTMFASRGFTGAILANTVAMVALIGNAIFMTQYLQLVLGLRPFNAALWSLVPSVAVGGAAPVAAMLAKRCGRAYVMAGGFLVAACGCAIVTQVRADSPLALVLVGSGVLSVGLIAVMTLVTEIVLGVISPARAGAASALMETGSELGGALGIAVLGSIGAAAYRAQIADRMPAAIGAESAAQTREGLAEAMSTAGDLPGQAADQLLGAAREAFTHGMNVAALVAAVLMVSAALLTAALLRGFESHDAECTVGTFGNRVHWPDVNRGAGR